MVKKRIKRVERKVREKTRSNLNSGFSIKNSFKDAINFLKESRNYIFGVFIAFLLIAVFGFFFPIFFNTEIMSMIKDLVKQTEGLNLFQLIGFIIFNNIKSAFFGLVFGLFFSVAPIIILIINGYVIGFVSNMAVQLSGPGVLLRLLPHGIFEVPAILISLGIGIKLGLYPIGLKDKEKGFLSLLVIFCCFILATLVISTIFAIVSNPSIITNSNSKEGIDNILNNPLIMIFYILIIGLTLIGSVICGLRVLSIQDRETVIKLFKNCFLVFLFIVVPLLIIAGIIEGSLIILLG